jgi:nitrite reductase/ring-hydroxylating ferredoxin subunit
MLSQIPQEVQKRALDEGAALYTAPHGASYLVVHQAGAWRVFANLCPHRRLRLDRGGQLYFTADKSLLVCVNHGARFQPLTGKCVAGPCLGKQLQRVPELEASHASATSPDDPQTG